MKNFIPMSVLCFITLVLFLNVSCFVCTDVACPDGFSLKVLPSSGRLVSGVYQISLSSKYNKYTCSVDYSNSKIFLVLPCDVADSHVFAINTDENQNGFALHIPLHSKDYDHNVFELSVKLDSKYLVEKRSVFTERTRRYPNGRFCDDGCRLQLFTAFAQDK